MAIVVSFLSVWAENISNNPEVFVLVSLPALSSASSCDDDCESTMSILAKSLPLFPSLPSVPLPLSKFSTNVSISITLSNAIKLCKNLLPKILLMLSSSLFRLCVLNIVEVVTLLTLLLVFFFLLVSVCALVTRIRTPADMTA